MIKKILIAVVALVVLVVCGAAVYLYGMLPRTAPPKTITIERTAERLARGEYLAMHVNGCIDCHSSRDFTKFSAPVIAGTEGKGGFEFGDNVDFPGSVYASNITPAALGAWTDGEVLRAITEGVSKDGSPLFPMMPYPLFAKMPEDDLYAVIAYIRTLKPIPNETPARRLDFPLNFIVRTIPTPVAPAPKPDTSNRVAYGEHVVTIAGCAECHTQMDDRGAPLTGMRLAGGSPFKMPDGTVTRSSNITFDTQSGIGLWTEEQFLDKFRGFRNADASSAPVPKGGFNTMMPWTAIAGMKDEDLQAIYAYLRTVPKVSHVVKKTGN